MDMALSELFVAVAQYGLARGIAGEGIHKFDGPDGITVTMNSTKAEYESLPPYHAALYARGWPIAVINPYGGEVLHLTEWDEGKLIAAFTTRPPQAHPSLDKG